MSFTEDELATRVLRDLSLYGPDETPSDDDLIDTKQIIGSEVAAMATRGIVIWGGSEVVVPPEYLTALSRRLGLAVGPTFGSFTIIEAAVGIEPAEHYLRQLSSKTPTGETAEAEYF